MKPSYEHMLRRRQPATGEPGAKPRIGSVKPPDPWIYDEGFFSPMEGDRPVYEILRDELTPYFTRGIVKLYNKEALERRMTCYFTTSKGKMIYSGRTLDPVPPPEGSYIHLLLELVASQDFRDAMEERHPRLKGVIPVFNAVFVNYYRRPQETEKPDYISIHCDDTSYLASDVILSVTYCPKNGARLFKFHEKPSSSTYKEYEICDGGMLVMLPTCQDRFKHSVSDRKTTLKGEVISEGRISITFRCVKE